jgi:hypothetical protein
MSIQMWVTVLAVGLLAPEISFSQVYLTKAGALKLHFADTDSVERRTVYLTEQQVTAIQLKAKARIDSRVVTYYLGRLKGKATGYAFLDRQTVRTMPVVYMVVVNPDTTVRAVEILAFHEPEDYLPTDRWLAQFEGTALHDELWLKRDIQNVVGATLSAQTLTQGVRRVLALFEVAVPKGS